MTISVDASAGSRALYLRWRPRVFAEVVGQDAVTRTLRNAVARGTVAHGYLLCGPRGTGKTSLARILFKALNCHHPSDGEPCGTCPSCQASDAGRALDLIEIDAASNRGIDDIRALRERARFAPSEARWKVYIVDEAHQLTPPAWDAFLKTLEEPPPRTVFVLATTAAHKVPPTIVSRCQRFDLGRIPQARIAGQLARIADTEGITLDDAVAQRVARLARGGLRDAIGMLEQVAVFAGNPVTLEAAREVLGLVRGDALRSFIEALAQRDCRRALQVLEDVAEEGADLHQFLDEVLDELRLVLLARVGAERGLDAGAEERDWLRDVALRWAPVDIVVALRAFSEIPTVGVDDHQLLVRLELAAATATAGEAPSPGWEGRGRHADAAPLVEIIGAAGGAGGPSGEIDEERQPTPSLLKESSPAQALRLAVGDSASEQGAGASPKEVRPAGTLPSLAVLQAHWPAVLERFQGTLFAKMLLGRLEPTALDDGVVTFEGRLDRLELQRVEASSRRAVETLLSDEVGVDLRVRFGASAEVVVPGEAPTLADYASSLFGGHVISERQDVAHPLAE